MPKIKLDDEWTFRNPLRTITFQKGEHTVDEEVAKAADEAGVTKDDKKNANSSSNSGSSANSDAPEG